MNGRRHSPFLESPAQVIPAIGAHHEEVIDVTRSATHRRKDERKTGKHLIINVRNRDTPCIVRIRCLSFTRKMAACNSSNQEFCVVSDADAALPPYSRSRQTRSAILFIAGHHHAAVADRAQILRGVEAIACRVSKLPHVYRAFCAVRLRAIFD